LRHLKASAAHAVDPFPAGDRAARLQQRLVADEDRTTRVRRAIEGLELALQPVVLPVGFSSRSSSAIGSFAVSVAERYLGVPYVWGGANPSSGFDCSGFVKYVYAQLGIQLPHYAASQYATTTHIDPSQLEAGDLVFFEPHADGPGHVGIYVGNGLFIEAPHTGDVVKLTQLLTEARQIGFVGATRPAA
jgi:cell wall-associated NlpC family hydrolase